MQMLVDKSLVFNFPRSFFVLKWDDSFTHMSLSNHWQFPCECAACPSHQCTPKRRNAGCSVSGVCRAHVKDGLKSVDLVAEGGVSGNELYLIEVKDFTSLPNEVAKNFNLCLAHYSMTVAKKFRDTLFSLWCGSLLKPSSESVSEQTFARRCRTKSGNMALVFHFESPLVGYKTGLFKGKKAVSLDLVRQRLFSYTGPEIGQWLQVVDCESMARNAETFPWTVRRSSLSKNLAS